jgi:hypothetical protein
MKERKQARLEKDIMPKLAKMKEEMIIEVIKL